MKITFPLTDEKTVTNSTLKVVATISGAVNDQTREEIEARCLAISKELFNSDQKWAFSNFTYNRDGLTFAVSASTRIDAGLNDGLDQKAANLGTSTTRISIANLDPGIPMHERRKAESELRANLIKLAQEEADKLGGEITKITFEDEIRLDAFTNHKAATYMQEASAAPAAALGHSEKFTTSAIVTVEVPPA